MQHQPLKEILEDFYAEQEYQGNSPATLLFYTRNFEHFLKDTNVTTLEDFNARTIRAWLLDHKHLSPNSLATYDRCLRVLANWLYRRGYLEHNPMLNLPKPRGKRMEVVTFSESEIRAMLRNAKTRRNPLRDTALLTLLIDTGARIGEALSLKLEDIDWQEGWFKLDGKTGVRSVPFGRKTKAALKRYIDQERTADHSGIREVFLSRNGHRLRSNTMTHHIIRIARAAKAKASKMGPHTFRHTFAVEFIRAGGDAFTLQRILGHSTLEMTRRYVHLAKSDLRSAHKRFAPGDRLL